MKTASAACAFLILCVLGLSACGGENASPPEEPWPTAEERTLEPDHAPTPYTAAQIRAGCAPGRVSTYRFEEVGKEPYLQTFHFLNGDEVGCNFEIQMADLEGKPLGDAVRGQNTWAGFQQHASYPQEQTTITDENVHVPAGTYRSIHYSVKAEKDGKPMVTDAWFARSIPGPPVKMLIAVDGRTLTTMTLLEHVAGAPQGP